MSLPRTRQTLLDDHFNYPSPRERYLNFLDLPSSIRERIYNDACDARPEYSGFAHIFIKSGWNGKFETAASLMLTCRQVHDEVFKFVYSQNQITIDATTLVGLNVLRKIGPQNLASLSELGIRLIIDRAATPSLCFFKGWGHDDCVRSSQSKKRLSHNISASHFANLQRWHHALNDILPYLPQSNLNIALSCDLQSMDVTLARDIARHLLSPLHGRLTLAGCSIHLGSSPSVQLGELAEEVALRATGEPTPVQQRLSFLDLPHEIRIQILTYTDLVTWRKEVEWRPGEGYWTSGQGEFSFCFDDYEFNYRFCRRANAAFSSRCICWLPPQPLFLLCRTLRQEAEQVFFKQNRIVVKPSVGINRLAGATPPILEASYYLKKVISAHALWSLRVLEIVFSPLEGTYLQEHEPAYQDWLSTLDFIKDKFFYPKFVLRIAFSAWAPNHVSYGPIYYPEPSQETITDIFESYKRTLLPLRILREHGLAHLQLDLALPSWLHRTRIRRYGEEGDSLSAVSTEREIETRVMGAGYADNMPCLSDSLWKLVWLDYVFNDGCKFVYKDRTMDISGL